MRRAKKKPEKAEKKRAGERARTRLYMEGSLKAGARFCLGLKESHYVGNVLRMKKGEALRLFNERDGEWSASVLKSEKGAFHLEAERLLRAPESPPNLWLLSAPIKNPPMSFLVRQAVEMGVSRFQPVLTKYAVKRTASVAKLKAAARDAAQQSESLWIPEIEEMAPLPALLEGWERAAGDRQILFCDEEASCASPLKVIEGYKNQRYASWAVLIGPEGGFAPDERRMIEGFSFCRRVSLGPRLLRAETAAVAALTLFQSALGDWSDG